MDFTQFSANGLLGLILLTFAGIGLLKGLVKLIFFLITTLSSLFLGYWIHQKSSEYFTLNSSEVPANTEILIASLGAIITFITLSQVLKFLVNPFENQSWIKKIAFGIPSLLISLTIGSLILWGGLIQLRHSANMAQLHHLWLRRHQEQAIPHQPFIGKFKDALDASHIGKHLKNLDPFHDQAALNLIKLITLSSVHSDYLSLSKDSTVGNLMREPRVWEVMTNQRINELLNDQSFQEILKHPKLQRILADEKLRQQLLNTDPEKSLAME